MKTYLQHLLRGIFHPRHAVGTRQKQTHLWVEGLETRDVPAAITFSGDTIYMVGTAGDDYASASVNTFGDNNVYNDIITCKVAHNGVTETQSYALYKWSQAGPVRNFNHLQFDGMGGSDTMSDLTSLNLNVYQNQFGSKGQAEMGFWSGSGEFSIRGTDANDIASFGYFWSGIYGKISHEGQYLTVYKQDQINKPIITRLEFEGRDGDDYFINNTYVDVHAFGGWGKDTLIGGAGNDLLVGDGDTDGATLETGYGCNDVINGQDGNDTIYGDGGDDQLFGGKGNDSIYAGKGADLLDGFDGDDYLQADAGNDLVFGGAGKDAMWGNNGDDSLWGGAGNDTMYGDGYYFEVGNDHLYGEAGDDTMYDAWGSNFVYGGVGNDCIFVGHAAYFSINYDVNYVEGNLGNDYIASAGGTTWLHGGDGNDTLLAAQYGYMPSNDHLIGEGGDDELLGGVFNTYMDGGAGNDLLMGGTGDDLLMGGIGRDLLIGGDGVDVLDGGAGDDLLIGSICDTGKDGKKDYISGGAGNDIFFKEVNKVGGNTDLALDFAAGDTLVTCIDWGQWLIDVGFQK